MSLSLAKSFTAQLMLEVLQFLPFFFDSRGPILIDLKATNTFSTSLSSQFQTQNCNYWVWVELHSTAPHRSVVVGTNYFSIFHLTVKMNILRSFHFSVHFSFLYLAVLTLFFFLSPFAV